MTKLIRLTQVAFLALVVSSTSHADTAFSMNKWRASSQDFKLKLIGALIQEAKKHSEVIRLPPEYYVRELDLLVKNSIANGDEEGLKGPLMMSFS